MDHFNSIDCQKFASYAVEQYTLLQNKFQKACSQVILLNNQIQDAQIRYDRATSLTSKPYMYMGKMKLMTLEGVRNQIYEYAAKLADKIDEEQEKLVAMGLMEEEYEPVDTVWTMLIHKIANC